MDAPPQPSKILQRMLERLHVSLANGPLLSCRPHSSRQRIDLVQLGTLVGTPPEQILPALLAGEPALKWKPGNDDLGLLAKLRTIAEDAKTYEQDTGVHALFVGYPLLHLPPETRGKSALPGKRVLAPVAFVPVQLAVKTARPAAVTIACAEAGSERVVPNAALFAWLQQVTGHSFTDAFADDEGADPWRELNELTAAVCRALDLPLPPPLDAASLLVPTPRSDREEGEEPQVRAVVASAVLGLFPVSKQGLVSDLQALAAGEPTDGPIASFLCSGNELGLASESAEVQHRVASERCVGAADPCQLRAVRLARRAAGLVIHGPPGTGKSQTITNIIADHLAAGERVLFVCDKRTALEVVHHRLQHVGLGQLCAVVHDPRRDPRELYRAIREQLDALPEAPRDPSCSPQLEAADRELRALHDELAQYTSAIMDRPDGGTTESLHELVGRWFGLEVPERWSSELAELRVTDLHELERDTREMLARGQKEQFAANPWTTALGIGLHAYLDRSPPHWQAQLRALENAARDIDDATGSEPLGFDAGSDLSAQARARSELAALLREVRARNCGAQLASWAAAPPERQSSAALDHATIAPAAAAIAREPLDRELAPAASGSQLQLAELALSLGKLASYLEIARKWFRFVFVRRRREARAIVERFGFALGPDVATRVHAFLAGLRARRVVHAWYRTIADAPEQLPPDSQLTAAADDCALIFRLLGTVREEPGLRSVRELLTAALREPARHAELEKALAASERRAHVLQVFRAALDATELLDATFRANTVRDACAHEPVHPDIVGLSARQSSIEGLLRIRERLARLPEAAREFHLRLLEESADADSGWAAVRKAALCAEIARRLRAAPVLHELDADRIRATYARYRAVEDQRRGLAARAIVQRWTELQRARLLASTGGRLNGAGAEVRRRLVSRGERAMRLRQVVAAGANIEGGDPLLDLRPVWMTSPEVVAQVFPREPLFDLVVFDEASQCRLEETLPVLTRARRVVIAGDPKQLPPTRFFELASNGQSQAELEAESEQELFEEQQVEVEDLLGAALNLAIEQAYLDVHYRSENADLIQFSNHNFYEGRLQPIPAHPSRWRGHSPLRLVHAAGVYDKRANPKEAAEVVRIVRELLGRPEPPSIGIACFNLSQRDAIVEALDRAAASDPVFGAQLSAARARRGAAAFEGLFVKNLESVQGDERDQIIISTTYGPDAAGRFYRRFGPLGLPGGGRRLNVLVTRAREAVHIVTSIPREIYSAVPAMETGRSPNGAWLLFAYLRYADTLAEAYDSERARRGAVDHGAPACRVLATGNPSELARAVGRALETEHGLSSEVHWGNDGFGVDVALSRPSAADGLTLGVMCDATRYEKAPDRVQWDIFRSEILEAQGWRLLRLWTPQFFRQPHAALEAVADEARRDSLEARGERTPAADVQSDGLTQS